MVFEDGLLTPRRTIGEDPLPHGTSEESSEEQENESRLVERAQ
jgi:hypothetical protein